MLIRLSGTLLRFTDFQKELQIDAPTLKGGIDKLVEQYPDVGKALYDHQGQMRATHRLFINGEAVGRAELGRELEKDDVVDIMTAITGG
jgi:sulfur-carrier protein